MGGLKIFSCSAPYNQGGLGKILAQMVERARAAGELGGYFTSRRKPNDPSGVDVSLERFRWMFKASPLRYSLGWKDYAAADLFDREVSTRLTAATTFHGVSGRAGRSFKRARQLGYERLLLESASSHVEHVMRQHRLASTMCGKGESWLNRAQVRKTLREYETADYIYVLSEYSRQTFLEAGFPEARLRRRVLKVERRFAPPLKSVRSAGFTVIYVGRLQVSKGLTVLLDAFRQIHDKDAELILVGGVGTREMENYLKMRMSADKRIKLRPGDPLPSLHRADVLVHPSFEDGLGLAPLEALASGVPVIVTEDTGMKEYVMTGRNGYVLPTGNSDALVEQLRAIRLHPLKGAFEPFANLTEISTGAD
jgi:glycosyltransferase involved in cell wall biosynthesis